MMAKMADYQPGTAPGPDAVPVSEKGSDVDEGTRNDIWRVLGDGCLRAYASRLPTAVALYLRVRFAGSYVLVLSDLKDQSTKFTAGTFYWVHSERFV